MVSNCLSAASQLDGELVRCTSRAANLTSDPSPSACCVVGIAGDAAADKTGETTTSRRLGRTSTLQQKDKPVGWFVVNHLMMFGHCFCTAVATPRHVSCNDIAVRRAQDYLVSDAGPPSPARDGKPGVVSSVVLHLGLYLVRPHVCAALWMPSILSLLVL